MSAIFLKAVQPVCFPRNFTNFFKTHLDTCFIKFRYVFTCWVIFMWFSWLSRWYLLVNVTPKQSVKFVLSSNKDTRKKSLMSFWCLYCELWTNFSVCSGIFIVEFELVNTGWEFEWNTKVTFCKKFWQLREWTDKKRQKNILER